jgi:hypothetical protein
MNLRLRDSSSIIGLFLIAFSAVSAAFVLSGAMRAASPVLFVVLVLGMSGVPAAVGIGIVVNHQQVSIRAKRTIIGMAIILIVIAVFGWMFWMVGEAGYNQTNP